MRPGHTSPSRTTSPSTTRRPRQTRIAIRVCLGLLVVLGLVVLLGLVWPGLIYWMLSNTVVLALIRIVLFVVAVAWAGLFVDAWRLGQPLGLLQKQRLAMVGLNGLLCISVAGTPVS